MSTPNERPGPVSRPDPLRKYDKTIDKTLEVLQFGLKNGRDALDLAPVPGLPLVVDILLEILDKVQTARATEKGAREMCEDIQRLHVSIRTVATIRLPEYKPLADSVQTLQRALEDVRDGAQSVIQGGTFRRIIFSGSVEEELSDMMEKVAKACRTFQMELQMFMAQSLIALEANTNNEHGTNTLDRLSTVAEASFRAARNASTFVQGTRETVFKQLARWQTRQDLGRPWGKPILVLIGGAGTGKSTIAAEFCKRLREGSSAKLGASFFFRRGLDGVDSPLHFFSTIAVQLADSLPYLRPHIITAASSHLKAGGRIQALPWAFHDLIDTPFKNLKEARDGRPLPERVFIVIDALDECTGGTMHTVSHLLDCLLLLVSHVPTISIMITSRNDGDAFPLLHHLSSKAQTRSFVRAMELNDLQDLDSVSVDIEKMVHHLLSSSYQTQAWYAARPDVARLLAARAKGDFSHACAAADSLLSHDGDLDSFLDKHFLDSPVSDTDNQTRSAQKRSFVLPQSFTSSPSVCSIASGSTAKTYRTASPIPSVNTATRMSSYSTQFSTSSLSLLSTDPASDPAWENPRVHSPLSVKTLLRNTRNSTRGPMKRKTEPRLTNDVSVLYTAMSAIQAGRAAAGTVAVPGLSVVFDCLTSILEVSENMRWSNKEGLRALCEEIHKTSEGIVEMLNNTARRIEHYPAGTSVREAVRDPERKEYTHLSRRISLFESQLRDVRMSAEALLGRSWSQRLVYAAQDATTLTKLQNMIAHAYQRFQFDGSIHAEQMLIKVVDQIIGAEINQVFDKLSPSTVNPDFRAAVNSGKSLFLPGTRKGIFDLLDEWAENAPGELQSKHALILEGGAGMGKSTVASEFCRRLQEHGRLGASFFFTRGVPDLESATAVIPSMAKQLARASEIFCPTVTEAAKKHLKDGGQQQQIRYVFAELLEPLRSIESPSPIYIVIDALDECRQDSQARELTELCRSLLSFVTESTSFRLFLTTRPIPDSPWREVVDMFKSSAQLHTLSLHGDLAKTFVNEDIASVVRALLSTSAKAQEWCDHDDTIVPRLVKRADGLLIYARAATAFLMEDNYYFDERLALLMPDPGPADSIDSAAPIPLYDLDNLYCTLLTTAFPPYQQFPTKDQVRRVLAGLLVFSQEACRTPAVFDSLLLRGMPPARSGPILERLRPVLTVDDEDGPVEKRRFTIMHPTFREFVTSDGKDFHISLVEAHTVVAMGCMEVLRAAVKASGEGREMDGWDRHRVWAARYAFDHWEEHVSRSRDGGVVSEERDALAAWVDNSLSTDSQRNAFDHRLEELLKEI